jgi:hypothetical protein
LAHKDKYKKDYRTKKGTVSEYVEVYTSEKKWVELTAVAERTYK